MTTPGTAPGQPSPRLIATRDPTHPIGVALVLHGGGGRGNMPVSPTQLSVLRMVPVAARIARAGHGRIAVYRLLNAVRGFGADPLSNVRWALAQIGDRNTGLPVCLVGHSLGGSVALAAAGEARVHSVVALAPWLAGSESTSQLAQTPALIVHGSDDRVTNCRASQQYATQARQGGAPVSFVEVEHGEHTMLRRMPAFDLLAARYTHAVLDPDHADRHAHGYRSQLERLAVQAHDTPADYGI
jgi:pimeloyl-ACP methyl ester carboxylesterase